MLLGALIGAVIMGVISGFVIWLVSLFGLGLEVDSFRGAFWAALAIAVVNAIVTWILNAVGFSAGTGIIGLVVNLVIAAVVIYLAAGFVPGFRVKGFTGALIAAVAISLVTWGLLVLVGGALLA